jgi:hypothetical protein
MDYKKLDNLINDLHENFINGNRSDVWQRILKLSKGDAVLVTLRLNNELNQEDKESFLRLVAARV